MIMKTLSINAEIYSEQNLTKCRVYRYVGSTIFQILFYSIDSTPVCLVDHICDVEISNEILSALTDDSIIERTFNVNFERIYPSRHLGYPTSDYLDPEK